MRCITIQNKNVYKVLMKEGVFVKPSLCNEVTSDIKTAYMFMKEIYHYENMPIFLAPVGYKVEFYGANFDEYSIALELDIPEEYLKIQNYYDWSDFIYFIGQKQEFIDGNVNYKDVFDFGKDVLSCIANQKQMDDKDAFQLTTDILRKEWIVSKTNNICKLELEHNGSGGQNTLKKLHEYK